MSYTATSSDASRARASCVRASVGRWRSRDSDARRQPSAYVAAWRYARARALRLSGRHVCTSRAAASVRAATSDSSAGIVLRRATDARASARARTLDGRGAVSLAAPGFPVAAIEIPVAAIGFSVVVLVFPGAVLVPPGTAAGVCSACLASSSSRRRSPRSSLSVMSSDARSCRSDTPSSARHTARRSISTWGFTPVSPFLFRLRLVSLSFRRATVPLRHVNQHAQRRHRQHHVRAVPVAHQPPLKPRERAADHTHKAAAARLGH